MGAPARILSSIACHVARSRCHCTRACARCAGVSSMPSSGRARGSVADAAILPGGVTAVCGVVAACVRAVALGGVATGCPCAQLAWATTRLSVACRTIASAVTRACHRASGIRRVRAVRCSERHPMAGACEDATDRRATHGRRGRVWSCGDEAMCMASARGVRSSRLTTQACSTPHAGSAAKGRRPDAASFWGPKSRSCKRLPYDRQLTRSSAGASCDVTRSQIFRRVTARTRTIAATPDTVRRAVTGDHRRCRHRATALHDDATAPQLTALWRRPIMAARRRTVRPHGGCVT